VFGPDYCVTGRCSKRRPVVASAVGGIADLIVDRESGILLPDRTDLHAFAGAIDALVADPALRSSLGERARERVVDRFLPDTQLARWGALMSALLT
jgi:trehalose synthase